MKFHRDFFFHIYIAGIKRSKLLVLQFQEQLFQPGFWSKDNIRFALKLTQLLLEANQTCGVLRAAKTLEQIISKILFILAISCWLELN